MFNEDQIYKQIFKLNYEKQQKINQLEKEVKGNKYHIKYIRKETKEIKCENIKLKHYISNLEKSIMDIKYIFKKGIDDDLYFDFLTERKIIIKDFLFSNKNKITFN